MLKYDSNILRPTDKKFLLEAGFAKEDFELLCSITR
jgi:hypothetical protein